MEKCKPECDILKKISIAKRPNPVDILSSFYGVLYCELCGTIYEGRPDYEGIYFNSFEGMVSLRKSLGYDDSIDNIEEALKDKVDLNTVSSEDLTNYMYHPLEVTEKPLKEYYKKLEAQLKAEGRL